MLLSRVHVGEAAGVTIMALPESGAEVSKTPPNVVYAEVLQQ